MYSKEGVFAVFMTVKEAAEKWGISDRRVRSLCAEGKIPGAYQQGRAWKIPANAEITTDQTGEKSKNIATKNTLTAIIAVNTSHIPFFRRLNIIKMFNIYILKQVRPYSYIVSEMVECVTTV